MKSLFNAFVFLFLFIFIQCSPNGKNVRELATFAIDEISIYEVVRGSNDSLWPSFCDMSGYFTMRNNGELPVILKVDEDRRIINCYFMFEGRVFPLKTSFYLNDTLSYGESKSFHANIPGRELKTVFSQTTNCDSLLVSMILEKGSFLFIQNDADTIWSERSKNYKIRFDGDSF